MLSDPYVRAYGWTGLTGTYTDGGLPIGCINQSEDQVRFTGFSGYYTDSITGSQSQTLQSGATTFVFAPVVAGTQSFTVQSASLPGATSVYYTPSPLKVWWAPPTKLQMLVEGSAAPDNAIERVFGIRPMRFEEALRRSSL